jgi:hypothetical protein
VHRLKVHAVAYGLGASLITALWVIAEWNGDWNPTLWATVLGIWGFVVGIMALRVHFERPVTVRDVDLAVDELDSSLTTVYERRSFAYRRIEGLRRLKFHAAAWVFGMAVIVPLNVLIEWQDNGGFERFSRDSQPGSWDPWVIYVGAIWALVVAILAIAVYVRRLRRPR